MTNWSDQTEAAIRAIASEQWAAMGGRASALDPEISNLQLLPGPFGVTQMGAAAFATLGTAVSELHVAAGHDPRRVGVDVGLASAWLSSPVPSLPDGWERPLPWSDVSADYPTADGRWVRLQANYPHLRRATAASLGAEVTPESIASAMIQLDADEAVDRIMEGGGAAAATRTQQEWADHPQGSAVAAEPFIDMFDGEPAGSSWSPSPDRPLRGLRILDITRVLAGPTGTKYLAGLGAEVLRIDPTGYREALGGSGGDLMLGKRCANLDLDTDAGRAKFLELLADADVFVHGLRNGALEGLGLGEEVRRAARPGLIEVTLNAYGWTGPWIGRRGFDTLVQTAAGFSTAMMAHFGLDRPKLLPAQVMDIGIGYLIAATTIRGLTKRLQDGRGSTWRLSLARAGRHIYAQDDVPAEHQLRWPVTGPTEDIAHWTPAGPVRRLLAPLAVGGSPLFWEYPGDPYGSATPMWVGSLSMHR